MTTTSTINFVLNGEQVSWTGDASTKLLDVLRDDFTATEVKCGCREGECGACSVLLDGTLVNSCLVAAGRVQDCAVETLAGLRTTERFTVLDAAFARHSAVQCGYCIPGMIIAAEALLSSNPHPTEAEIRVAISGNLCRCTGYNAIVTAILEAAETGVWESVKSYVPPTPSLTSTSLTESLELLAHDPTLTPYAGGTDLLASEHGAHAPAGSELLFVSRIPELRNITRDGETLRIGAAVTYGELLASELTPASLRTAVASIAAPAVRNAGTIGGNIANASPKGDAALICFVTDCTLRLVSSRGERLVPIQEFYLGRGKTLREPDELLAEILLPTRWLDDFAYEKVGGRKALAISRVSFAALFAANNGVVEHLACAFGAVEDVVIRRPEIDALLIGLPLGEAKARVPKWLAAYDEAIQPIRGRVSAEYRKQVCLNLAQNFAETRLS